MLLNLSMKYFEFATPVSSTPFNLNVIILGCEEGITKGVAAKDFPAFIQLHYLSRILFS